MLGIKILKESDFNDIIASHMDKERELVRSKEREDKLLVENVKLKKELKLSKKVIFNLTEENEQLRKGQEVLIKKPAKRGRPRKTE